MDNRRRLIALLITALVFMGITGFLLVNNNSLKNENASQKEQIDSLTYFKQVLQNDLKTVKEELNAYKGKNKELDQLLANANHDIEVKEKLIRQLSHDQAAVKRLKAEIAELKNLRDGYLKKIQELEALLAEKNQENAQLQQQNKELISKVSLLEQQNAELDKKVKVASTLQTGNIIIVGEKKGKGGKYAPAKMHKAERLSIAYEINENKVATPGERTLYIRILSPDGKLIQNKQSGSFTNIDKNVNLDYTQSQKINYNNSQQKIITPVELNGHQFSKGTYVVEFYCNGYFCGMKKIALK